MNQQQYPRIEINPVHCGIYREYHDKRGRRRIQDGPYVTRRKIRSEDGKCFIFLDGKRIPVKKVSDLDEILHVAWGTYYTDRR